MEGKTGEGDIQADLIERDPQEGNIRVEGETDRGDIQVDLTERNPQEGSTRVTQAG